MREWCGVAQQCNVVIFTPSLHYCNTYAALLSHTHSHTHLLHHHYPTIIINPFLTFNIILNITDDDLLNDETFGGGGVPDAPPGMGAPPGLSLSSTSSSSGPDQNLPSFFMKNSGVTILDELVGLSMNDGLENGNGSGNGGGALEEDIDYSGMEGFNTDEGDDYAVDEKLPDFFSTSSKMYDEDVANMKIGALRVVLS